MTHQILLLLGALLTAAVIFVPLTQRVGLGSVLGYLLAGALVGPWGLKRVTDVKSMFDFAELGVVLLLFVIGLELKPSRLWRLRRAVFGMGGAQVTVTGLILALIGCLGFGLGIIPAALVGAALALSSTAFALQALTERHELSTEHGRSAFGILLFQDLAAIPLLALIPFLGGQSVSANLWLGAGKFAMVILVFVLAGRYLLRPAFRAIASSRSREIFTATALLIVVIAALAMHWLGLSMGLGTFMAGVLLADSEYRHELEADIAPFRGLLLGLFFMTVGMSLNFGLIIERPLTVLGLTFGILTIKALVLFAIARGFGLERMAARRLAFSVPQGGEFAFVLLGAAASVGLIAAAMEQTLTVAVSLSMAVAPLLMIFEERVLSRFDCLPAGQSFDQIPDDGNPVIIAGFGRVGQVVGRMLRVLEVGFTALELDSEQVHVIRRFGHKIYYGDASREDLLEAAGARSAKLFILAIDDPEESIKTVDSVKKHFPNLKILARARNRQHAYELMDRGVEVIHRETLDSSLSLVRDMLGFLGYSAERALELTSKFKTHDELMLRAQHAVHHDEQQLIAQSNIASQQLTEVLQADSKL